MPAYTKDTCQTDITLRILSTDLPPGTILDEASLAARYGLSRTPLREVIQRLAGAGYVALRDNRGAKVASMDIGTMRTFFQTAPMVYANIARLAAENRSAAQLDALKLAQQQFMRDVRQADATAAALCNHRFHAIIGEMAQNTYLVAALNRLLIDHTRMSNTFYQPQSKTETALIATAGDQHDAMIAAIEAQEPALAIDLTLQHWDLSRDHLERYVRPDPLPVDVISLKDRRNAV